MPTRQPEPLLQWTVERTVRAGFGLVLVALVMIGGAAYRGIDGLLAANDDQARTSQVMTTMHTIQILIYQAEASQRGYLLTGQSALLDPYLAAQPTVAQHIQQVRVLVDDDSLQQQRLIQLEQAVAAKFAELQELIDRRQAGEWQAQTVVLEPNSSTTAAIDSAFNALRLATAAQRAEQTEQVRTLTRTTIQIMGVGGVLMVLVVGVASRLVRHDVDEHQQSEVQLQQAYALLDQRVQERTAELIQQVAERERAQEQVRQLNLDLERRVNERTALLETANRELETFSYSVSHDLRAPVRHIDGYSLALLEDYGHVLDQSGQQYLQRIRVASQRMGQLIDDMLHLSRITRAELHRTRVNLSNQATQILAVLREREPDRMVDLAIAPDVVAQADPQLVRLALENLLGNAWKFTRNTPRAQIVFGTQQQEDATVYFVRDNGAGFDMAYADKLFSPFQRLHSDTEFEGTGVGLATVQRVVQRHGGRIWAEGAVGEGATFFWTLEQSSPTAPDV